MLGPLDTFGPFVAAGKLPDLGVAIAPIADGRLSLSSGLPVTLTDVVGATTLYYVPYIGNRVALYVGGRWQLIPFTAQVSLALSGLTSGKNYDVFLSYVSGVLWLTLGTAWSTDTARSSDAIVQQDGVYCRKNVISGDLNDRSQRYLGTIRATGATTTEDSRAKRFVWNYGNRRVRSMRAALETVDSWVYTTATFRQANANTANQLDFVIGLDEDVVWASVIGSVNSSAGIYTSVGIGLDSTSVNSATLFVGPVMTAAVQASVHAYYNDHPGQGRHTLVWLEQSVASGTTTWYGDDGSPTTKQAGILGQVIG